MAVVLAAGPWWAFVVRGALGIVFGILAFVWPGMALLTLVLLFGVYAVADGLLDVAAGLERAPARPTPRWALLVAGAVGILAGIAAFLMPGLTAIALLYLIAAWAIVRGVLEIAAAIALRKEIEREWLFVVAGVVSVAFGLILMVFPGAGALAVVLWIGAYAIVFGALLVAFGFKLRNWTRSGRPGPGFHELAPGSR